MIRALVTGTIYGEPQARTSQAGKQYVIAFGEQADRLVLEAQP